MPEFRLATPKPLITITAFLQTNFYKADPLPFGKSLENNFMWCGPAGPQGNTPLFFPHHWVRIPTH